MKVFYCRDFKKENKYLMDKYTVDSLSKERKDRMNLIKNKEQRDDFLMAEYITLEILEKEYGIYNPNILGKAGEKPRILRENKFFNRSYAKDNMVIVFDDKGEIGVDCEEILPVDYQVMDFFFTDQEKEYVKNSENQNLAFTEIWTRKESYMKYSGEGLKFQFNLLNTLAADVNIETYLVGDTVISVTGSVSTMEGIECLEKGNYEKDDYRLF